MKPVLPEREYLSLLIEGGRCGDAPKRTEERPYHDALSGWAGTVK